MGARECTMDHRNQPEETKAIENLNPSVSDTAQPIARPTRLSTRTFLGEIVDEVFSLDRGLPWTFRELLRHPGTVIRRYVEWRDSRLTRPLRYLLVALALAAIAFHLLEISGAGVSKFEAGFKRVNDDAAAAAIAVGMLKHFDLLSDGMAGMCHRKDVEVAYQLRDVELPEDPNEGLMTWYGMLSDEITKQSRARGENTPDLNAVFMSDPINAVEFIFPHYFVLPVMIMVMSLLTMMPMLLHSLVRRVESV